MANRDARVDDQCDRDSAGATRPVVAARQLGLDELPEVLQAFGERATDLSPELGGGWGGWREILVNQEDRARALDVLADAQRE